MPCLKDCGRKIQRGRGLTDHQTLVRTGTQYTSLTLLIPSSTLLWKRARSPFVAGVSNPAPKARELLTQPKL
jgi:hypothetical protein